MGATKFRLVAINKIPSQSPLRPSWIQPDTPCSVWPQPKSILDSNKLTIQATRLSPNRFATLLIRKPRKQTSSPTAASNQDNAKKKNNKARFPRMELKLE